MQTMHLFAGTGGGLLADRIFGHDPVIAVEWNKYAAGVLRQRAADGWFPNLRVWEGDVALFDPSAYAGRVDCIHAGFPCQDLSVAGANAGLGEGTRSGLYRQVLCIAGVVRPQFLFLENVSAIIGRGLGVVLGDLSACGYDARWVCIRASDVGAPHARDRWFLLAKNTDTIPQSEQKRGEWESRIGAVCEDVANPDGQCSQRLANWGCTEKPNAQVSKPVRGNGTERGWWKTEPGVGRVADGVAHRVDRIKAIGNGQVPLQAAAAFKILMTLFTA